MEFLQYVLALIVTIGILVTIHELGHFFIARASGVMVTRFSVGFGPALWSRFDKQGTEWVVAALPLGGYVRMLDERESEVPPALAARSFNRLTPQWRIAIATGGPLANFVLAFGVYWWLFVMGSTEFVPVLAQVEDSTPAYAAGLRGGEEIVAVDGVETPAWPQITMALAARLGDTGDIVVSSRSPGESRVEDRRLRIDTWHQGEDEPNLLASLGIKPTLAAVMGEIVADSPAAAAGLQRYDRVLSVDGEAVRDWADWVDRVRSLPDARAVLDVERSGERLQIPIRFGTQANAEGNAQGFAGVAPLLREIEYSWWAALPRAAGETYDKTVLTLNLLKKMVMGLVSPSNLSGPITIAKVAGDSARSGLPNFLAVLALLSISLGVLNLLPIPILDGGHIVFCTAEWILRRPVPDRVQALGVQIGLALVGGLMLLAIYNDIARLF